MNVKELLKSVNKKDVFMFMMNHTETENLPENMNFEEKYKYFCKCYDDMLRLKENNNENEIVFVIPSVSMYVAGYDTFTVHKDELLKSKENKVEHYGYEFDDWKNILGYQVANASLAYVSEIDIACAIYFELTFFGYSYDDRNDSVDDEISIIDERVKQVEEDNKNGNIENYKTIDEMFKEIGYKDERTDLEKDYDNNMTKLEIKLYTEWFDSMLSYEKKIFLQK